MVTEGNLIIHGDLIITIDTPVCSLEEFAKRAGYKMNEAINLWDDHAIPHFSKDNHKRMVNLALLHKQAITRLY